MTIEPIPDDCLPFNGDEAKMLAFLREPKIGADGKIQGDGPLAGMTPDEVRADREAFRRACGE
jgi:hypothetical protein